MNVPLNKHHCVCHCVKSFTHFPCKVQGKWQQGLKTRLSLTMTEKAGPLHIATWPAYRGTDSVQNWRSERDIGHVTTSQISAPIRSQQLEASNHVTSRQISAPIRGQQLGASDHVTTWQIREPIREQCGVCEHRGGAYSVVREGQCLLGI